MSERLSIDVDGAVTMAVFKDLVIEEGALHTRGLSWPCERLEALGESLASARGGSAAAEVFRLVHVRLEGEKLSVWLAAPERRALDEAERTLRHAMPRADVAEESQEVRVNFWTYGAHGPWSVPRRIAVPTWEEIAGNYTANAAKRLTELRELGGQVRAGQLLLWHGPPGTGKTHALRALAWEWREWCDMHYVMDPEVLLGAHPDYLVHVLLDAGEEAYEAPPPESRWRLLILEDSGELIAADAKAVTGQALSRLHNLVDGLIGQGFRVMVLITTNEEIRRLHPAVSRPGRCLSSIEFPELPVEVAQRWLEERGVAFDVTRPLSLADLYALADGNDVGEAGDRPLGFSAA
jgi:hypothetical protein